MNLKNLLIVFITALNCASVYSYDLGGKTRKKNPVNVHIIAIGLNDNGVKEFGKLNNCENDATAIVHKIKNDAIGLNRNTPTNSQTRGLKLSDTTKQDSPKSEIFTHLLLNKNATLENIRAAFKEVIKESTTNDYFYFYFAGMSIDIKDDETILVTYNDTESSIDVKGNNNQTYEHLRLAELANFMNQIAAKNQIIISEAGVGKSFSQNLQSNLFELDPDLALNSERNRIILTTINFGYDSSECNQTHGPLTYYVLNSGNIFQVFNNYHYYEYLLNKNEIACSPKDTKYYYISQENDYKKLLAKRYQSLADSRGSKAKTLSETNDKESKAKPQLNALIIATNNYNGNQQSWGNLKNPINDANAVADILEAKYGVKVFKLYNEPKQEIKKGIIKLKQTIDENDKLFVFIAGHGYYSEDFSQGFIVTTDSKSIEEDIALESYLPMSTLNALLDGFECKPIFTVLDVCYGANFELNNADLVVESYANTIFDNGIDKFIKQTDKSYSRIVLASGQYEVPDYWNNSLNHSPFANKLIKALENEREFISPGKIFSYVRGNTTKPILKKFGKHEVTGDFLLPVIAN